MYLIIIIAWSIVAALGAIFNLIQWPAIIISLILLLALAMIGEAVSKFYQNQKKKRKIARDRTIEESLKGRNPYDPF